MSSVSRGLDAGTDYDTEFESDPRGDGDVQVIADIGGVLAPVGNVSSSSSWGTAAALPGVSSAVSSGARQALICASGGSIRLTLTTGTLPTSSVGMLVGDGGSFLAPFGAGLANIRAIEADGSPSVSVVYVK